MRHVLLLLIVAISVLPAKAQYLTNPDFETLNDTMPANWYLGVGGTQLTTNYVHSGSKALVAWTWYYYATGYAINGGDANGWASEYDWGRGGEPINEKAVSLTGYYYYDTVGTNLAHDTAYVGVMLKRYDTLANKVDTVGFGETYLFAYDMATTNGLQQFQVDIVDLMPNVDPDTVVVFIASRNGPNNTCIGDGDGNCMYLYVDDLELRTVSDTTTGLNDIDVKQMLHVFPNPANSSVSVMSSEAGTVRLVDMQGRVVLEEKIEAGRQQLDISDRTKGVYLLEVISDKGMVYRKKLLISE